MTFIFTHLSVNGGWDPWLGISCCHDGAAERWSETDILMDRQIRVEAGACVERITCKFERGGMEKGLC